MKAYEKAEYQAYLDSEKATIEAVKKSYEDALAKVDEKIRVLSTRTDVENMPSIIYQKKYQEQLKSQIEGILDNLQESQYKTIEEYLNECYEEGFMRSLYSLNQQGIPFAWPIDQKAVEMAVVLDSKISGGLYSAMGVDVAAFKKNISSEISRGIASSMSYAEIARNLKNASKVPISNASRIVRTEGHRIQNQAKMDTMTEAQEKGADVVKQWDSTLDGKTRETHRELDGQIRELDEYFEVEGKRALMAGGFGDPAEDCNCRCQVLQRARWALSSGFSKMDNFSKELQSFESPADYDQFKKAYWSDENIKYMNYVQDMEDKYGTKNFEKVLDSMSDREYAHYKELMEADPMYKSINGADSVSVRSDAQKMNGDFAKASSRYLNHNDKLYEYAAKITPEEDFEDIVSHGDPYSLVFRDSDGNESNVSAKEFCEILEKDPNYKGGNIRLIACEASAEPETIPQYIADYFGVDVKAPTEIVNVDMDGNMILANSEEDAKMGIETGEWKTYHPRTGRK